jgi:hypothetical protein
MEKSAWLGKGGGVHAPPPFHSIYHLAQKFQCTLQLRGQKHSLYFTSTLYVLYVGDVRLRSVYRVWMRKAAEIYLFTCCNIFFRLRWRGPVGPGAGGCNRCGQQGLQQQPAADRRTEAAPPPATRQVGYSTVQYSKISV